MFLIITILKLFEIYPKDIEIITYFLIKIKNFTLNDRVKNIGAIKNFLKI